MLTAEKLKGEGTGCLPQEKLSLFLHLFSQFSKGNLHRGQRRVLQLLYLAHRFNIRGDPFGVMGHPRQMVFQRRPFQAIPLEDFLHHPNGTLEDGHRVSQVMGKRRVQTPAFLSLPPQFLMASLQLASHLFKGGAKAFQFILPFGLQNKIQVLLHNALGAGLQLLNGML